LLSLRWRTPPRVPRLRLAASGVGEVAWGCALPAALFKEGSAAHALERAASASQLPESATL